MNTKLTRAWIENGSPPLDDLAPAIGMSVVEIIDYMRGRKFPTQNAKELLAEVLGKTVQEIF